MFRHKKPSSTWSQECKNMHTWFVWKWVFRPSQFVLLCGETQNGTNSLRNSFCSEGGGELPLMVAAASAPETCRNMGWICNNFLKSLNGALLLETFRQHLDKMCFDFLYSFCLQHSSF
jgi:hypothetical protein